MKLYAVVDRKAKNVVNVFASLSDEAAERSFLMLLTGPKNIFTDFPEDFDLYPVCDLSVASGLKVSKQVNENLEAAGFKVNCFDVLEPLKAGVDYDKRYLAMLHHDRFELVKEEKTDAPSD